MSLFTVDADRADKASRATNESTFAFLDRMPGEYWDHVRHLLEDWFSHVDTSEAADLEGRLRSADDRQVNGAFFELYLHESLLRMGYTLTAHPALPHTRRQVDFLASNDDHSFYLEARFASPSDIATASAARIDRVYDALENLDSPLFWLSIDIIRHTTDSFSGARLRKKVNGWLKTLEFNEHRFDADLALKDQPVLVVEDPKSGWVVHVQAIARPPHLRDKPNRTNVLLSSDDRPWADNGGIAGALENKGSAYGDLDAPFIVAIASQALNITEAHITSVLFGNGHWDGGESGQVLHAREPNGYWHGPNGWQNTRVSAVLIVPGLRPWTVTAGKGTLWTHPDPTHAIGELPMWRRAECDGGEPTFTEPDRTHANWYELADPWPPGDPRP